MGASPCPDCHALEECGPDCIRVVRRTSNEGPLIRHLEARLTAAESRATEAERALRGFIVIVVGGPMTDAPLLKRFESAKTELLEKLWRRGDERDAAQARLAEVVRLARELVEALPVCDVAGHEPRPATMYTGSKYNTLNQERWCDGCSGDLGLPFDYTAPLRALLAVLQSERSNG